jgi:hypothetical protein
MRVPEAQKGKETLDEKEAAFAGGDLKTDVVKRTASARPASLVFGSGLN